MATWEALAEELDEEFGGTTMMHCHVLGTHCSVTPVELGACNSCTHGRGSPVICEYGAPRVSADDFLGGLREMIRANQTPEGPCVGCRYLVRTTLPERFAPTYLLEVSLHDFCGCNSNCVYCAGSEYELPDKYVAGHDHLALFRSLIDDGAVRPGLTAVSWGGGEPTLLNTFAETVELLRASGVSQLINTSGINYSPETAAALQDRLATVQISVDSGTNETFLQVKRNAHCDDVWDSIRRYAAVGGDFVVKYIIFNLNSDESEVRAFVERCVAAGVKNVSISVDARSVWGDGSAGVPLTDKEFGAAALMWKLCEAEGIRPQFESIWTDVHLARIGEVGGFEAYRYPPLPTPTLLRRVAGRVKRLLLASTGRGAARDPL